MLNFKYKLYSLISPSSELSTIVTGSSSQWKPNWSDFVKSREKNGQEILQNASFVFHGTACMRVSKFFIFWLTIVVNKVFYALRIRVCVYIRGGRHTCFLCADGQLFAGLTASNLVVGVHANAVHRCRVELHYVGLVVGGWDLTGGMFQLPRVYDKDKITDTLLHHTSIQTVLEHYVC